MREEASTKAPSAAIEEAGNANADAAINAADAARDFLLMFPRLAKMVEEFMSETSSLFCDAHDVILVVEGPLHMFPI
jgi:hypothetical protein